VLDILIQFVGYWNKVLNYLVQASVIEWSGGLGDVIA